MKKLFILGALAFVLPVFAGDTVCQYSCQNMCPLAKQANQLRCDGDEAITISPAIRKDISDRVTRNLDRI